MTPTRGAIARHEMFHQPGLWPKTLECARARVIAGLGVGLTPDEASPRGVITRVVQGVGIHGT